MITNLKDWKKLKLNEDAPRRMHSGPSHKPMKFAPIKPTAIQ